MTSAFLHYVEMGGTVTSTSEAFRAALGPPGRH